MFEIIYSVKDLSLEYTKNSYNSVIKKINNSIKNWPKYLTRYFNKKRYRNG